jgi:hypothetical protein
MGPKQYYAGSQVRSRRIALGLKFFTVAKLGQRQAIQKRLWTTMHGATKDAIERV